MNRNNAKYNLHSGTVERVEGDTAFVRLDGSGELVEAKMLDVDGNI